MESSLPCTTTGITALQPVQGGSHSRARAAEAGDKASPPADQDGAVEPAPELWKHSGTCTSHSSLAFAVERASRKTQPLNIGEQNGLCLSQFNPQPQEPPGPMEGSSQHCS